MQFLIRLLLGAGVALLVADTGSGAPRERAGPGRDGPAAVAAPSEALPSLSLGPESEPLVNQLRAALVDQRDSGLDQLMRALRLLKDPALKPLYAQLASADRPVLRVHGILGLAELEGGSGIDLLLVKRLSEARDQAVVLGEALRSGLLTEGQLDDVAQWPGLDDTLRTLIYGELIRRGRSMNAAELIRLAQSPNEATAVFAALFLRQIGQSLKAADDPLERLLAADQSDSRNVETVLGVLSQIREAKLDKLVGYVRDIQRKWVESPGVGFECVRTILALEPRDAEALKQWAGLYAGYDLARRVRMGLIGLGMSRRDGTLAAPALFQPMADDPEPVMHAIGEVGLSIVEDKPAEARLAALLALTRLGHVPTLEWALADSDSLPGPDAIAVRLSVIAAAADPSQQPGLYQVGAAAAAVLAGSDPEALKGPLSRAIAAGDERLVVAILAGVLQSGNSGSASLADEVPASMATARAVADLVIAQHTAQPDRLDFDRLAAIAGGAGSLPEAYRVQAAWLALRAKGEQRVALARVLAEAPPK
ncbi:MAG: hypothetical protein KF745_06925 [Phycisphaeraceae bacterium]|nr:hypothetical protein [Phycisphaeraceae bacterium]